MQSCVGGVVNIPENCGVTVRRTLGKVKGMTGHYVVGGVSLGRSFGTNAADLGNSLKALLRRVLFEYADGVYTPIYRPTREHVERELGETRELFLRSIPCAPVVVGMEDYPSLFTGSKRTVYERAVETLRTVPLVWGDFLIRAFVKREKVNTAKDPRLIQPRSARFNVCLGRFLKKSEKVILKGVDRAFGDTVVAKGMTQSQVGELAASKWSRFLDPVAVSLDAARFDKHVSPAMLAGFEHRLYNGYFKDAEVSQLLEAQLRNRGYIYAEGHRVDYTVDGCRMSGDVNTSLGNTLIMCGLVHAWCKRQGIASDAYALLNNGDDSVVFMDRRTLPYFSGGLSEWFASLGFPMEIEAPVFELEHVVFCQSQPVHTPEGWLMVRQVHNALTKDGMCLIDIGVGKEFQKWMGAVGDCGIALTGGIPVFQAYYNMCLRFSEGHRGRILDHPGMSWVKWMTAAHNRTERTVSDETRYSFWRAFGIMPHDQRLLEAMYDSITLPSGPIVPLQTDSQVSAFCQLTPAVHEL